MRGSNCSSCFPLDLIDVPVEPVQPLLPSNRVIFHMLTLHPGTRLRVMPVSDCRDANFASPFDAVIEKLRLFLVILEEGSLRRAAERLHISQSAISRPVQLLEHDLGGRVLERTSAGVRPTSGGHALSAKTQIILPDYHFTMDEVRRFVC